MEKISDILRCVKENAKGMSDVGAFEQVEMSWADDFAQAKTAVSFLSQLPGTDEEAVAQAEQVGSLYIQWRSEGAPSTTSLIFAMAECVGLDHDAPFFKPLIAAGVLADMPSENSFHSNAHYRDVLCTAFRLVMLHQKTSKPEAQVSVEMVALFLMSVAVHDFTHDGGGNVQKDGTHTPMRLEKQAASNAASILQHFDLGSENLEKLESLILGTDVSLDGRGSSPSRFLKSVYAYHYSGDGRPEDSGVEALDRLLDDKELCLLAMMVEEADLFTSVGLNYDYARLTTVLVARESGVLSTTASTLHGFIEMMCSGMLLTPAGQMALGSSFALIEKQAAQDVGNNVDYDCGEVTLLAG